MSSVNRWKPAGGIVVRCIATVCVTGLAFGTISGVSAVASEEDSSVRGVTRDTSAAPFERVESLRTDAFGSSAESSDPEGSSTDDEVLRLIVVPEQETKAGMSESVASVEDMLGDVDGVEIADISLIEQSLGVVELVDPLDSAQARELIEQLEGDPSVASVEVDGTAGLSAAPPVTTNDPYLYAQWGLWDLLDDAGRVGGYGVDAPVAWQQGIYGNPSVVVAVIDSGRTAHSDLDSNTVSGYDMVSLATSSGSLRATGSRDGNGRDPDPTDPGDWCEDPSSWHGTHVAGIIAAQANNGRGVSGVAPGVKVQHVRALGACGLGSESDIAAAIVWASGGKVSGIPTNQTPAKVINMSLGGRYAKGCPAVYQKAIDAAVKRGSTVVVSAGNEAQPLVSYAPVNCNNVIRVTATGWTGQVANYSNYGTAQKSADVSAPGGWVGNGATASEKNSSMILSTWNAGATRAGAEGYGYMVGTSMAAPFVSGIAALMLSANPSLSPAEVRRGIMATATAFPGNAGCSRNKCGTGIANAGKAVGELGMSPKVAIKGTAAVGKTLTAATAGWVPSRGVAYSYQWFANGSPISGATGKKYKVKSSDRGKRITVQASGSRYRFVSAGTTSKATGRVKLALTKTPKPKITGTKRVGKTLKVKTGKWGPGKVKLSFRWYRNGKVIKGATKARYTLKNADRGKRITVKVTGKKAKYSSVSKTSSKTAKIKKR